MENREQALRAYREAIAFSPENALARIGVGLDNPDIGGRPVDIAQALLRDPSVPSLRFKPGVTSELTPGIGSDEDYRLDGFHRDRYGRGRLHDLSFFNLRSERQLPQWSSGTEHVAMTNLAAAPTYRTHVWPRLSTTRVSGPCPALSWIQRTMAPMPVFTGMTWPRATR